MSVINPEELREAFSRFNEVSVQLTGAYTELEQKASELAEELAVANGQLRQQYQEKAALSERLSVILAALPSAVIVVDREGAVIEANMAAINSFGIEVLDKNWEHFWQAYAQPVESLQEWEHRESGKETLRYNLTSKVLDGGGAIHLIQDVTEAFQMRKRHERNERLALMGEMSAGLAHQLRTPLATALLYAGNLLRPDLGSAAVQKFSRKLLDRLQYLEQMIQDMLLFLRGQSVVSNHFLLSGFFEELKTTVEPQILAKHLELRWNVDIPDPVSLYGQRKDLLGALLNLFDNAMQAMASPGIITFSAKLENTQVVLEVSDTGVGMSTEVLAKAFQPFFTTRPQGTGLGLAVVQNVIRQFGGQIEAQSMVSQGTVFNITLPVSLDDQKSFD